MFHRVKSEMTDQEIEMNEAQVEKKVVEQDLEPTMQQSLLKEEQEFAAPEQAQVKPQNVYQRVGSASVRPGVQYSAKPATPSYKTATPSAPAAKAPSSVARAPAFDADVNFGDRKLTIGRGITMSGEIESCDFLHVEGTVEAALRGATQLNIAESGVFYGTVEIENATIAGRFEGEIVVNGRLTIESTGVITGSISYRDLSVESGAVIDGRITPLPATTASKKSAHVPQADADLLSEAAE